MTVSGSRLPDRQVRWASTQGLLDQMHAVLAPPDLAVNLEGRNAKDTEVRGVLGVRSGASLIP